MYSSEPKRLVQLPPDLKVALPFRIFHGSCRLSADAIVSFVRALCAVSKEELNQPATPRMFLLGKLVEVTAFIKLPVLLVYFDD